eukprot:934856-Amphidinium_carterae.1
MVSAPEPERQVCGPARDGDVSAQLRVFQGRLAALEEWSEQFTFSEQGVVIAPAGSPVSGAQPTPPSLIEGLGQVKSDLE